MFVDTNQLVQLLPYYQNKLGKTYEANEIEQIFFLMAFFVFGLERIEVRTKDVRLSESELLFQKDIVSRLLNKEPIQYILSKAEFYEIVLTVSPAVLIPRPETAELIDLILAKHSFEKLKVVDIGTGSGCIPLALKSNRKEWQITGIDVSEQALEIATKNSEHLNLQVEWLQKNILTDTLTPNIKYDVIVSNPPYVLEADKAEMHTNVLMYEPFLALFVPTENPLLFYNRIIGLAKVDLKIGGTLYFEIHENFGQKVQEAMQNNGFINCNIVKDLQGKDRFVIGELG